MSEPPPQAPDETPSSDEGDETARRYRYQWTQAAGMCCQLLDNTFDVVEVFCEQHEDILVKHSTGQFTGLQVKTRASDQPPWKTRDEGVRKSLARFAVLERDYPGCFRAFRFLTNHPLYRARNGQDLLHVLELLRTNRDAAVTPKAVSRMVSRVAQDSGCSESTVLSALAKVEVDDYLPKLQDSLMRLVTTLTQVWDVADTCSHPRVVQAAHRLIAECERASSLAHLETLPAYLPATASPRDAELRARINGKRFDVSRVRQVLADGLSATAPLDGDLATISTPGAGPTALLRKKLDAGGFSAVSVNSAEDLRNKADYLAVTWQNRYGETKGLQRYTHVQSVVLSDAATAFEATKGGGDPFGVRMLSHLRDRLRERLDDGRGMYQASPEHLEGFAYGLTALCKVTWSVARPWEAE